MFTHGVKLKSCPRKKCSLEGKKAIEEVCRDTGWNDARDEVNIIL